jgi:hypothetical protein
MQSASASCFRHFLKHRHISLNAVCSGAVLKQSTISPDAIAIGIEASIWGKECRGAGATRRFARAVLLFALVAFQASLHAALAMGGTYQLRLGETRGRPMQPTFLYYNFRRVQKVLARCAVHFA